MPQIIIENLFSKKISFHENKQVLAIMQENFIDYMHACGGKGRCTTCKMIVVQGIESLSKLSPFESKCREKGLLADRERLACQCVARDDITILIPKENKLPHMDYSD